MGVNCSSVQQWVVQLIFKMHKVLVSMPQDLSMSPDLPRVLVSAVLMLSQDIILKTMLMDIMVVSVLELASTHLDPSMNPDLPKVLVSVVLNPDILVMDSLLMVMLSVASALE